MLNNLRAEMARSNVLISDLAECLGVRYATVSDKASGKSRFYYDEADKIRKKFFPNCSLEYLFEEENTAEEETCATSA